MPGRRLILIFFSSLALIAGSAKAQAQDQTGVPPARPFVADLEKLFAQGRFPEMEAVYDRGHAVAPHDPELALWRGRSLTALKRYAEALPVLTGVKAAWDEPRVDWALGELYMRQELWTEAVRALRPTLKKVKPAPPWLYANLGVSYWRLGKTKQALKCLKLAVAGAPNDKELQALVTKVEREAEVQKDYQVTATQYFDIAFETSDDHSKVRHKVEGLLERALADVATDLDYPTGGRIQVVLYPNAEDARTVTGAPAWARASFDGKLRIPLEAMDVDPEEVTRVLRHELTHIVVSNRFGNQAPGWLNEGLAKELEGAPEAWTEQTFSKLVDGDGSKLLSMQTLTQPSFMGMTDLDQVHAAYSQSLFAVRFLKDRWYGFAPVDVLAAISGGAAPEEALKQVTGLNHEEFLAELQAWGKKKLLDK